jgi:hypothetical protein
MDDSTNNAKSSVAHSIADLIEPVLSKLKAFNPGVEYESQQIIYALRRGIKSGRIKKVTLMPDQMTFSTRVEGDNYLLLLNLACKTFADLVMLPAFPTKKRIPRHQKEFATNLDVEIYYLENGDEMFAANP